MFIVLPPFLTQLNINTLVTQQLANRTVRISVADPRKPSFALFRP